MLMFFPRFIRRKEVHRMPNINEKSQVVSEIKEKFQQASGIVLADYRGLTVAQVTQLRAQLRLAGVEYRVMKNTLVRRAAVELGIEGLDSYLKGPTALAFCADPIAPAKVLMEFAKAVSYTHLRAHETRHDLVCRLLLEKKKIDKLLKSFRV